MKNCKHIAAVLFCAAAVLAVGAPCARGQVVTEPLRTPISTDSGTPVVVKQKPAKAVWLSAEVIHSDRRTLIVREVGNGMEIHTFTFSERAKDKMEQVQDAGGYQTGDHVRVLWIPGSSEALNIKGRPSKPI
ncbi:MAG: hypothetical protein WCF88_14850 [Candidatus Acidiferrales bacterium]|jgi:hypothetical protein